MEYIEPELREDRGELQAAMDGGEGLPRLIEQGDIRGDLHCHTVASDGHGTIAEMASAARELGYEYVAITDHSASHGFGNDVSADELKRQIERVREVDARMEGIAVRAGSEVNVLPDGELDYEDELLGELDWVVASVHTAFGMGEEAMTARMIRAIEHPLVDAIGHPTGRMIVRREPYAVDLEAVFAAAARTGTLLEINANPDRRDLSDVNAPQCGEGGREACDRLGRPQNGDAGEHALGHRDGAAGVADARGRGQYARVGRARGNAQTQSRKVVARW